MSPFRNAWLKHTAFSSADRLFASLHANLFIRYRYVCLISSVFFYAGIILLFGERLAISNNYFVIIPVLTSSLGWGLKGGFIAGLLGLPANLLMFSLIGHPEYSPASKLIAEISGIVVGTSFGYLSDYFEKLLMEIRRRTEIEESLRKVLDEKGILLHELQHRVKNNLNLIKSLINLQKNRSKDPEFIAATDTLSRRILSIAQVYDRLQLDQGTARIDGGEYVRSLTTRLVEGYGPENLRFDCYIDCELSSLDPEVGVPLGLVINEVLTNSLKYAVNANEDPVIEIKFVRTNGGFQLTVLDNGQGFDISKTTEEGLGLKIVNSLVSQIDGAVSWSFETGTRFSLVFPSSAAEAQEEAGKR